MSGPQNGGRRCEGLIYGVTPEHQWARSNQGNIIGYVGEIDGMCLELISLELISSIKLGVEPDKTMLLLVALIAATSA